MEFFQEVVMLRFYISRFYAVGHVLFYLLPLFLLMVMLRAIKAGGGSLRNDLLGVWVSVNDAWQCGEI